MSSGSTINVGRYQGRLVGTVPSEVALLIYQQLRGFMIASYFQT